MRDSQEVGLQKSGDLTYRGGELGLHPEKNFQQEGCKVVGHTNGLPLARRINRISSTETAEGKEKIKKCVARFGTAFIKKQ